MAPPPRRSRDALTAVGLQVDLLEEFPFVPFEWFEGMVLGPDGAWRLPGDPLPLLYALRARKPPPSVASD